MCIAIFGMLHTVLFCSGMPPRLGENDRVVKDAALTRNIGEANAAPLRKETV